MSCRRKQKTLHNGAQRWLSSVLSATFNLSYPGFAGFFIGCVVTSKMVKDDVRREDVVKKDEIRKNEVRKDNVKRITSKLVSNAYLAPFVLATYFIGAARVGRARLRLTVSSTRWVS